MITIHTVQKNTGKDKNARKNTFHYLAFIITIQDQRKKQKRQKTQDLYKD